MSDHTRNGETMTKNSAVDSARRPQPTPDFDTQGFWDATAAGELRLCRCVECLEWIHPPQERCPQCGGATSWELTEPSGVIYSFIIVRHAAVEGFEVPYAIALVDLADAGGTRLNGQVVGVDPETVRIGMAVRIEIADHPGGSMRIPVFVPVDA